MIFQQLSREIMKFEITANEVAYGVMIICQMPSKRNLNEVEEIEVTPNLIFSSLIFRFT